MQSGWQSRGAEACPAKNLCYLCHSIAPDLCESPIGPLRSAEGFMTHSARFQHQENPHALGCFGFQRSGLWPWCLWWCRISSPVFAPQQIGGRDCGRVGGLDCAIARCAKFSGRRSARPPVCGVLGTSRNWLARLSQAGLGRRAHSCSAVASWCGASLYEVGVGPVVLGGGAIAFQFYAMTVDDADVMFFPAGTCETGVHGLDARPVFW